MRHAHLACLLLLSSTVCADEPLQALREAAEGGDAAAQFQLAGHFGRGDQVEKDAEQMLHWLRESAGGGHAEAQSALGLILVERGHDDAARDAGREWLHKAAEQGVAIAMMQLGVDAIERGDSEAGLEWLRKAARVGDPETQYALGRGLVDGSMGKVDAEEAARWYRIAAEGGHRQAQIDFATALMLGEGVGVNPHAGYFWLVVAGDAAAEERADTLRTHEQQVPAHAVQTVRARAAAWNPTLPSMPYVDGVVVFQPIPAQPDMPLSPLQRQPLTDAVVIPEGDGLRMVLSPELLSKPALLESLDAGDTPSDVRVELHFDAEHRLTWALVFDVSGIIEIGPDQVQIDVEFKSNRAVGRIQSKDGANPLAGDVWIEALVAVPIQTSGANLE